MSAAGGSVLGSTRAKVLQGSIYLLIRRGIGTGLSFVGLLWLTRIVGPGAYGLFTSALSLVSYLQYMVQMGLGVYLIRSPQDTPRSYFHQAFCWLLVASAGMTALAILLLMLIGTLWVRQEGFTPVIVTMALLIPFSTLSVVPMALLERELDYRRITFVELGSQLGYYTVGIAMAHSGWGVWSLVGGHAVSQLVLFGGFYAVARYRPRWYWNRTLLRDMLGYSFTQALSGWLYNLRNVAPSLILLPIAGKEVVGYYSLSLRFLSVLNFANEALGRVALPAFARIQNDLQKLRSAVTEAIYLRLIVTGIFYAGFMTFAGWLLPLFLGKQWDVEKILRVFLILAVPMLIFCASGVIASAIHVIRQNQAVVWANLFYILTYFLGTSALVATLSEPYKIYGFAFAEWIAVLANFVVLHRAFKRSVGAPSYLLAFLWLFGYIFAMLAPVAGWWLILIALPFFLNPLSIRTLRNLLLQIRAIRQHSRKARVSDTPNTLN